MQQSGPSWTRVCFSRHHTGKLRCRASNGSNELPAELQGLYVNDEGLLVDEKTGQVVNEYGATRFDVAVRALRGDFDPPEGTANTDREQGLLLSSLVQFPHLHTFNAVAKGVNRDAFASRVVGIIARQCQVPPDDVKSKVSDRMGGKYVSVAATCMVRAPEIVHAVLAEIGSVESVVMRY